MYDLNQVAANLKKHNFQVMIFETKADVIKWLKNDFPQLEHIGSGGSVTLTELGAREILAERGMQIYFHDHDAPETRAITMAKAMLSDAYLSSANALTADGYIINVDGHGNRVAALTHGPAQAFYFVGRNKIVENSHAGWQRIKDIAGPKNAARLDLDTPCVKLGKCADCSHKWRICNVYSIMRRAPRAVKSTVILINEDLGY